MPRRAELRERSERVPRSAHATPLARVYTYAFLRLIYPWNLVLVLERSMDLRAIFRY